MRADRSELIAEARDFAAQPGIGAVRGLVLDLADALSDADDALAAARVVSEADLERARLIQAQANGKGDSDGLQSALESLGFTIGGASGEGGEI
jgi:hypothetical protein